MIPVSSPNFPSALELLFCLSSSKLICALTMIKNEYIPWSSVEEDHLSAWLLHYRHLSWKSKSKKYYQDFGRARSPNSLRGKQYQLLKGIRRRRPGPTTESATEISIPIKRMRHVSSRSVMGFQPLISYRQEKKESHSRPRVQVKRRDSWSEDSIWDGEAICHDIVQEKSPQLQDTQSSPSGFWKTIGMFLKGSW